MKFEIEIPEWAYGKNIHIFAGVEKLAEVLVKTVHENGKHIAKYLPLKIKPEDGRCTGCGSCCNSVGISRKLLIDMKKALHGFKDYEGKCPFITDTGCLLRGWIPFSCAKSICTDYEGCTERLEVIE